MQIQTSRERGSILLAAIFICGVIGIALAAYIQITGVQHVSVVRAQTWNGAINLAEGGIEEAMAQLQMNGPSSVGGGLPGNLALDSWTFSGNVYSKQRYLDTNSYYIVSISNNVPPVVTSQGFIRVPQTSQYIKRTVQVLTTNNPMFFEGALVKNGITSNGNSVKADAFDSGNSLYSSNGLYVASKATDGGGIATLSSVPNALNFGSGNVYGKVSVGPGGSIPASLNVGTHAWQAANTGVQPGYLNTNLSFSLYPVPVPAVAGALTPGPGKALNGVVYPMSAILPLGLITYTYILQNGNYLLNSGNFNGKVLVTGNATLYVTTNVTMNFVPATGSITILTNASLNLYVGARNVTLPDVSNGTGQATNFYYFGLPSNTNIAMTVNADFVCSMYAPNAKLTLGGNGTGSEQKLIGAFITDSINYNDFFSFHFDIALGRTALSRGYGMASWSEM
jgi:hypothetical protein